MSNPVLHGAKCIRTFIILMSICSIQAAELRVDLSQAGKKVSPNLFGLFLEEINHEEGAGRLRVGDETFIVSSRRPFTASLG
jgi:hypothetical protein